MIWIDITGMYCPEGIDEYWVYEPEKDDFGDSMCHEWLAFRRELYPNAYEWKYEPVYRHEGHTLVVDGVYLKNPFDNLGWRWVLHRPPDGVLDTMQRTHPFVTFHYEEP